MYRNCCGASAASEQQHKQDLRRIYRREQEFSHSPFFTRIRINSDLVIHRQVNKEYFENNFVQKLATWYVMNCVQLLVCRVVVESCIVRNVRLHIFNNFLVIWDKVALDESDVVHRLTQNTRNMVLPDTEYFENRVPKLPNGCRI